MRRGLGCRCEARRPESISLRTGKTGPAARAVPASAQALRAIGTAGGQARLTRRERVDQRVPGEHARSFGDRATRPNALTDNRHQTTPRCVVRCSGCGPRPSSTITSAAIASRRMRSIGLRPRSRSDADSPKRRQRARQVSRCMRYFFAASFAESFLSIVCSTATFSFAATGIAICGRPGSGQSRWKKWPRGWSVRS